MAQIDPREIEEIEVSPSGRPIGLDLIRLENTRFGLEVLGFGLLLVLISVGLGSGSFTAEGRGSSSKLLDILVDGLGLAGYALLAVSVLICAPTPNGFLPGLLRGLFALVFSVASLGVLANWLAPDGGRELQGWIVFQETFWVVTRLAPVALSWVLWRFCQHRGLIGRALVWLWIAMAWSVMALLVEFAEQFWIARFYPALGVLALLAARFTARDLWMDAVNRKTKKVVSGRLAQSAG